MCDDLVAYRVDVNYTVDGDTALTIAAFDGHVDILEHMIASMREIHGKDVKRAIKVAKKEKGIVGRGEHDGVIALLEDYQSKPFETVKNLRIKLKVQDNGRAFSLWLPYYVMATIL